MSLSEPISPQLILAAGILLNSISLTEAKEKKGFDLRDGDTVVFLGDSITAARTYGQVIENYTLLRFPDRTVRFVNAGVGGDTAAGGAARLERDVFSHSPTVVTVAYGINDIKWGFAADQDHKRRYLNGIRKIVTECVQRDIRVYICSAAITSEPPDKAENGFLLAMCDEGMQLARELGGKSIDVNRQMREIQRRVIATNERQTQTAPDKALSSLHVQDGVHLTELGQIAMAFSILKGLGAPRDVSSVAIDFDDLKVKQQLNCQVRALERESDTLRFARIDKGLPVNFGLFGALHYRYVPIHEELNRYLFEVNNLPAGDYRLTVNGRNLGVFSHDLLANGVNICSATGDPWQPGGPWDAQAGVLKSLTEARGKLAIAAHLWHAQLKGNSNKPRLKDEVTQINELLEKLQARVAAPLIYHYVLSPEDKAAEEDSP